MTETLDEKTTRLAHVIAYGSHERQKRIIREIIEDERVRACRIINKYSNNTSDMIAAQMAHDLIRAIASAEEDGITQIAISALTAPVRAAEVKLGEMPAYGKASLNELAAAVAEAVVGDRNHEFEFEHENLFIGHQIVPTINFNSLNRIVTAFVSGSSLSPGSGEKDRIAQTLRKAEAALTPLANAVFNDNGDMTVSVPLLSADQCISAYFAVKAIRAALTKEER
jgi:hypothetical protein